MKYYRCYKNKELGKVCGLQIGCAAAAVLK